MDNLLGIAITNKMIVTGLAIVIVLILIIYILSLLSLLSKLQHKIYTLQARVYDFRSCQEALKVSHQYDIRSLQFIYKNGDKVNPQKEILMKRSGNYYGLFYVKEGRKQIEVFIYNP